jgi:selenocysteine lyase/cysteine desulfurase
VDEEPARSGVDFFVAGTHKWLFGPRGTGMIWGRADAWPHVSPTVPSFDLHGAEELWAAWVERRPLPPTRAAFVSPGGFVAYEHAFAVAEAVEFHQHLGRARVASRLAELNGRFRAELAKMKRVRLVTPLDPKLAAGFVCFEIEGMEPNAVVARLKEKRIRASSSPYKISYARVAAGVMVSPAEVETTLAAIRELARA